MQEELKNDLDAVIGTICDNYRKDERYILTESDLVSETYLHLKKSGILEKYGLSLHTELRPFDPENDEIIRKKTWEKIVQINYAAKFDLALVDKKKMYWDLSRKRIAQAQTGTDDELKYWRFLLYPVESFRVVIEFKVRVKNNHKNIRKDITKMKVLTKKNKCCLKYLVILDRAASTTSINTIVEEIKKENDIHFFINS